MLQVHDKLLGMICDTQYHISRNQIMLKKKSFRLRVKFRLRGFFFHFLVCILKGSHESQIQQLAGPNFTLPILTPSP